MSINFYMKKLFILFCAIILVIFISGCTKLVEEKPIELIPTTVKEPIVSEADQNIIASLKSGLNSIVNDYEASYNKVHEVHSSAAYSAGATDYTEKSIISIKVSYGQVIDYSIRHTKDGWPFEQEDYYQVYDFSKKELCQQDVVGSSSCAYSETPIAPKMSGSVTGCKVKSYGGKHVCLCNGEEKSISINENIQPELPCSDSIQTSGLELWDEFNIIYYPSTDQSLCYFVTKSEDPRYAFECQNKNIKLLMSQIETDEELKNTVCRYSKYNYLCSCSFDNIKIQAVCEKETPLNFDSETKSNILSYLENIEITSISEEDNQYGHCYTFSHDELEHTFCFNEKDIITFAQWGGDISNERGTSVNINKIEMI